MSRYTNKWEWTEHATDEQRDCPTNKAAVERLHQELVQAYHTIPDLSAYRDPDRDDGPEFDTEEEYQAYETTRKKRISDAWGTVEACEEMMGSRGAVLCEDYAEHQEFASVIRRMEGD